MSNPFEVLKVEGEGAGTPSASAFEEKVADEEQVDWLRVVKPAKSDVHVRVTEPFSDMDHLPSNCSLMAVSNVWDLVFIGTSKLELLVFELSAISKLSESPENTGKASPKLTTTLPGRPQWIRLAMGDKRLLVGCLDDAGVVLFDIKQLLEGSSAPVQRYSDVPSPLVNLLPNPSLLGGLPHLALALSLDALQILDLDTQLKTLTSIKEAFTCIAWSVKGRQFVIGKQDGTLQQYAPDGSPKASVPLPDGLREQGLGPGTGYRATSISWIENDVFLVTYGREGDDPEHRHYLIHRQPKSDPSRFTFVQFQDIMGPWGMMDRRGDFRHTAHIKGWGDELKHLVFLSTPPSADIAVLYTDTLGDGQQAPEWKVALLDETARPAVPMNEENEDTTCLGLEVDLTSTTLIKQEPEGGESRPDLPAAPRLMEYTNDGVVVIYDILNGKRPEFPGMVKPGDLSKAESSTSGSAQHSANVAGEVPAPAVKSKLGASAFGTPESSGNAGSKPAFGFGQAPTKLPAFGAGFGGSGSAFGSTKPSTPAFGSGSAFGSQSQGGSGASTPAPAFGSSGFGGAGAGSGSTTPAFGSTTPAFGSTTPAFGSKTPAFGSTTPAFGSSAFGSSTPSTTASAGPAFGAAKSAFGSTAFGQPSSGSAFGASSAFGQGGAFGSQKTTSTDDEEHAKGTSEQPKKSAFGSTSTSAFGSSTAFGSSSAFGQTPTTGTTETSTKPSSSSSPFGANPFGTKTPAETTGNAGASKPPAFGSSPFAASSPGQPNTFGGKSTSFGFGSLSKSPASSPTTDTKPAFGSTSVSKPAFGASSFGSSTGSPASSKNAFGSSAFGSPSGFAPKSTQELPKPSAFGQSAAFGGFAAAKPSPLSQSASSSATPAKEKKTDAFSFGGFGLEDKKEDEKKVEVKEEAKESPEVTGFSLGDLDNGLDEVQNKAPLSTPIDEKKEEETPGKTEESATVTKAKPAPEAALKSSSEDDVQEVAVPKEIEDSKDEVETPTPAPSVPKAQTALGFGRPPSQPGNTFSFAKPTDQPSATFSFAKSPAQDKQPSSEIPAHPSSSTSSSFSGEIIKKTDIPPLDGPEDDQQSDGGSVEQDDEQVYDEDEVYSDEEDGELVEQEDEDDYEQHDEDDNEESLDDYDEDDEEATEEDERRPASPAKRQRMTSEGEAKPEHSGKTNFGHARTPSGTHVREAAQEWENKTKRADIAPPSFFQSVGKPHSPASQRNETSSPVAPPQSLPEPGTPTIPAIRATLSDTPVRPNARQVTKAAVSPASGLAAQFALVYNEVEKQLHELRLQAEENAAYHSALSKAPTEIPSREDIALAEFWYFGVLDTLASYTKEIAQEASEARQQGAGLNQGIKDMVAGLHKIRQRSDDCARYLKAFNDPELRRALRQRPLSSQQADEQKDLRRAVRSARENLFRAEIQLASMKRRVEQSHTVGSSGPSSIEGVTKEIQSLEIGLRERQDDLDSLSRRIDSLALQKTQSNLSKQGTRARPSSSLSGADEPVKLVSEAMNAELDGDLLLRAVKANRAELSMVPRPVGQANMEMSKAGKVAEGKGKFIGSKVQLRRPRTRKDGHGQVGVPPLVIPSASTSTATPQARSSTSTFKPNPTTSLFSRLSPGPGLGHSPSPVQSSKKPAFTLPDTASSASPSPAPSFAFSTSAGSQQAPQSKPTMQGFDFGLKPSTEGLNSRAGYRPLNKHQREKVEAGAGSVKKVAAGAGTKESVAGAGVGAAGTSGNTAGSAGAGFGSNFFAMPPTATKPGAPGAANPEVPKFNFGFGAAKK